MLEDVQDGLCRHFTMTLNVIYKTLCRYLGLPEVSETMLKARDNEDEPLILNGRVIFSPETGEPLKKRDWNRLIEAIETYLKRKLKEEDKRLVMRNTAVAKIIARRNGYDIKGERVAANKRSVQQFYYSTRRRFCQEKL